jgi:O-methyltransferase
MSRRKKGLANFLNRKLFRKVSRQFAGYQLSEVAHQVRSEGLTYLSTRRLLNIENCMKQVNANRIKGDILEFGVALGGSGILLSKYSGPARRYMGFDVFGMIPEPNQSVDGEDSLQRYEVIASGKSKGIRGDSYYGYEKNLFDKVRKSFDTYGLADQISTAQRPV